MKNFKENLVNALLEVIPNIEIREQEIVKTNDNVLHGLCFIGDDNCSPTLYVEDFYERFKSGESLEDIVREIHAIYLQSIYSAPKIDIDLSSWESIRDKLSVRLISETKNKTYLQDKPYELKADGLALVAEININDEMSTVVNEHIANGKTPSEVIKEALHNAELTHPPVLATMESMLFGGKENLLKKESLDECGSMYVLSNDLGMYGASSLFYSGVRDKIKDLVGSYYVLPSSVHEVIIVPKAANKDVEALADIVRSANSSVVDEKEYLSDNVFDENMKVVA